MNDIYDVNVLVNGNRCKQYTHQNRIFLEAKHSSEYTIEIKNNSWKRILVVCSVDGLNIISGKQTTPENGPGYVINGYSSVKMDGFRVSNEKVSKFVFDTKGNSYAASKKDGSEKNVGVIGVRIFEEKYIPIQRQTITTINYPITTTPWIIPNTVPSPNITMYGVWTGGSSTGASGGNSYSATLYGGSSPNWNTTGEIACNYLNARENLFKDCSQNFSETYDGFDTGTKWGESKESKIIEVGFERGSMVQSVTIYYATRESLIGMGVPIGNEKQINFPDAFVDTKYATPPPGWIEE